MDTSHYYAMIMAGGGGTRLWPMSRANTPKQLLALVEEHSMFRVSVERLAPIFPPERIYVVASEALAPALKADRRFTTVAGDVYARLAGAPCERFDLILIDVDHAPDDPLSRKNDTFYRAEGLERAIRHLAPGGILGVWSYAESSPFALALREVFRDVRMEPVTFFNALIDEETTDWLFFARAPG